MKSNAQIKFAVFLTVVLLVGALYLQGQSIIKPSINFFLMDYKHSCLCSSCVEQVAVGI
jgi:hypothetical protein